MKDLSIHLSIAEVGNALWMHCRMTPARNTSSNSLITGEKLLQADIDKTGRSVSCVLDNCIYNKLVQEITACSLRLCYIE